MKNKHPMDRITLMYKNKVCNDLMNKIETEINKLDDCYDSCTIEAIETILDTLREDYID